MAQVFDLVEQNKKKTQPVQQLAGEAGLPIAPVTAVGTGTLGGTPQQQAMAGTPAQKKSVLESVTKVARPTGETQLEQARLLRAPAEESQTDQASKARVQQLIQGLGTFGAKAVELVDAAKQSVFGKPATAAAEAATTPTAPAPAGVTLEVVTPDNLKDQPVEKQNKIKTLVSDIASETDPTKRNELIRDLNIELGKSPDSPMSAAEMDKFYASVTETVSKQMEEKVRRAIAGEDEILNIEDFKNLGISVEGLATLFNMAPADVMKLTVTDFQNKLAGLDVGTGEVQATTAGMSSGLLSAAERQALRGNLAQLEERGLAGAAVQYKSLLDDIDRGTTVSIGGQQYGIDELLADGTFADIADMYFKDPNSDWAKNLAKSEPGLVQWLTGNEKVLNDLISESKASVTGFGQLQTARADMFKGLDPKTVKDLTGIDLSKFATEGVSIEGLPPFMKPVLETLAKLPAGQRDTYGANIGKLNSVMGKDYIAKLDAAKLAEMKLEDMNGPGAQWLTTVSTLRSNLQSPNRETRLDAVTDGTLDWDSVDDQLAEENFRIAMGYEPSGLADLDANKDGKLTDQELDLYIKNNALSTLPTFEEFNSGTKQSITKIKSPPPLTTNEKLVFDAAKDDGVISADEVSGLTSDQLQEVLNKAKNKTNEPAKSLAGIIDGLVTKEIEPVLGNYATLIAVQPPQTWTYDSEKQFFGQLDQMRQQVASMTQALNTNLSSGAKDRITKARDALSAHLDALGQIQSQYTNTSFIQRDILPKLTSEGISKGAGRLASDTKKAVKKVFG